MLQELYLGETGQLLATRLFQHSNDEENVNDYTALACHTKEYSHKFNLILMVPRYWGRKRAS